uniref:Uncharacterized protein n=1 Tax=Anguilla anguilla TaxID=7936 RepID=A0A0E9PLC6_ANGAN
MLSQLRFIHMFLQTKCNSLCGKAPCSSL